MASRGFLGNVNSILLAGGLGVAERLLGMGWSRVKVYFAIQEKFTPIGGSRYSPDVYGAIVNRAESALESGRTLQRRQSNRPLDEIQNTLMPGLSTEYQYSAVVGFIDANSGREFSRLFRVGSDTPLGKYDILALVQQQALAFAGNVPSYSPYANSDQIDLTGQMRIADALTRI